VFCSEWSKMRVERSWGRLNGFHTDRANEKDKVKSPTLQNRGQGTQIRRTIVVWATRPSKHAEG